MAGGRSAHPPEDSQDPPASRPRPGRSRQPALIVGLVLLKVGVIAFGGPITHVAFMRRELVQRRGWLDEKTFFRMFAACNLIPGPSSTELAIFIGYRLAGWPGLLLAGSLFIAPAVLVMLAIAWAYTRFGTTAPAVAALGGLRPASFPGSGATRSSPPSSPRAAIQKIQHIVVIIQENCSFDEYFGMFPGADGLPRQNGQFSVCLPDPGQGGCVKP